MGAAVRFANDASERFYIVIGAEGVGSPMRGMVFPGKKGFPLKPN